MPNVMAALPNIGGALCESSVIPFLVPRRKVWLTSAAAWSGVQYKRCQYTKTQDLDVITPGKILSGATAPENVYIV